MSILKGLFPGDNPKEAVAFSNQVMEDALAEADLDERTRSIVENMQKGLTLGAAMGLSPEHIEAILTRGKQFVEAERFEAARDVLLRVVQLDPLEARAPYLMGVTYQMEGDLAKAAHFYMHFLALDATNSNGYMRLGECLMAAGETQNARDALRSARVFALEGKGQPENAAQAERLLALLDQTAPTT